MFLFLFLIFAGVAAGLWFHGTWSNALTIPSIILAGIVATNFFEPVASFLVGQYPGATYLYDFIALWAIFVLVFAILRGITESMAEDWIPFQFPVEMTLRTITALVASWIFVCFTAFTLHTAPLNAENPLGAWSQPMESSFLGMSPDRQWAAFAFSRSRGALSRGAFEASMLHPEDSAANTQVFDSQGDFIYKYHQRRVSFSKLESLTTD